MSNLQYEAVAASQTAQVLGATGSSGDKLIRLIVSATDATTNGVSLLDGTTTIFSCVNALQKGPVTLDFNIQSANGPFKITTAANTSVLAVGLFK